MEPKKLIVLTTSPHLYQGAGGRTRIVHELRQVLNDEANTVLLCMVQLKHYARPGALRAARKQLEADAGTRVIYWPTIPTFQGRLSRLALALDKLAVGVYARVKRCNRIHAQGFSAAQIAAELKKRNKSLKLLTDVHGVLPEEIRYQRETMDEAWFSRLGQKEKAVLEASDFVFLVSNRLRRHYREKYGLKLDNSLVVPCLTAEGPPAETVVDRASLEKINDIPANRLLFTYAGSYRKYQLVPETFDVFLKIKARFPQAFFLILTNQAEVFEATARERDLAAADYKIVSLPQPEVARYLAASDFGFMLRDDSVVNKVASPTKFAEYLAAGLPVITTTTVGDYSAMVTAQRAGYAIENLAEPDEGLYGFIRECRADEAGVRARARQIAAGLTWKSHKTVIVDTMVKQGFL